MCHRTKASAAFGGTNINAIPATQDAKSCSSAWRLQGSFEPCSDVEGSGSSTACNTLANHSEVQVEPNTATTPRASGDITADACRRRLEFSQQLKQQQQRRRARPRSGQKQTPQTAREIQEVHPQVPGDGSGKAVSGVVARGAVGGTDDGLPILGASGAFLTMRRRRGTRTARGRLGGLRIGGVHEASVSSGTAGLGMRKATCSLALLLAGVRPLRRERGSSVRQRMATCDPREKRQTAPLMTWQGMALRSAFLDACALQSSNASRESTCCRPLRASVNSGASCFTRWNEGRLEHTGWTTEGCHEKRRRHPHACFSVETVSAENVSVKINKYVTGLSSQQLVAHKKALTALVLGSVRNDQQLVV